MNFTSYSDEIAAPIPGHRTAGARGVSWSPHNIIAIATKHSVLFRLFSSSETPRSAVGADTFDTLYENEETVIVNINWSHSILELPNVTQPVALCAWRTVASMIEVIAVRRTPPNMRTLSQVSTGNKKLRVLPHLRLDPLSPAFSYHLTDFHWATASEMVLTTTVGVLFVNVTDDLDIEKSLDATLKESPTSPVMVTEARQRLAGWPMGFGPTCSSLVKIGHQSQLLIVAGLMTLAGRQHSILLGYELTPCEASPWRCRCAFAINLSAKAISIVTHFDKVLTSSALPTFESFLPSAIFSHQVASDGSESKEPKRSVVEVVAAGPSGTLIFQLSLARAVDETSLFGVAMVARFGVGFPNVAATASNPSAPISMQSHVPCDTLAEHFQDTNVEHIIPLTRAWGALLSQVTVLSKEPQGAEREQKLAVASHLSSHFLLIGSDVITAVGILRSTVSNTVCIYSDNLINIPHFTVEHQRSGISNTLAPLVCTGGVALHPSGACGVMICGISRQRKDETRLLSFTTAQSDVFSTAAIKYAQLRDFLSRATGTAFNEMNHDSTNLDATKITLQSAYEPHRVSPFFTSPLATVNKNCIELRDRCISLITSPTDPQNGTAGMLLVPSKFNSLATQHQGMYQVAADLNRIFMRVTLSQFVHTVLGSLSVPLTNTNAPSDLFSEPTWDASLRDSASLIPSAQSVPSQLASLESISAKLIVSLIDFQLCQLDAGMLSVATSSPTWLHGRLQLQADLYRRNPLRLSLSQAPYWHKLLIDCSAMLRVLEGYRTVSGDAVNWILSRRYRLTSELLLARSVGILQEHNQSNSAEGEQKVAIALAIIEGYIRNIPPDNKLLASTAKSLESIVERSSGQTYTVTILEPSFLRVTNGQKRQREDENIVFVPVPLTVRLYSTTNPQPITAVVNVADFSLTSHQTSVVRCNGCGQLFGEGQLVCVLCRSQLIPV